LNRHGGFFRLLAMGYRNRLIKAKVRLQLT
jgi:hypothetical protein